MMINEQVKPIALRQQEATDLTGLVDATRIRTRAIAQC
jgi:hypothetical protein